MIPPVDVDAIYLGPAPGGHRFKVRGQEYVIPDREFWGDVSDLEEGDECNITVDGWWLEGKGLWRTFKGWAPLFLGEDDPSGDDD